eukprot:1758885-Pyramimonas_sp.AAC.1
MPRGRRMSLTSPSANAVLGCRFHTTVARVTQSAHLGGTGRPHGGPHGLGEGAEAGDRRVTQSSCA